MQPQNIQFLKIFPLRGPSQWTYRPALEAWVDIGDLEDFPSNTIPGFVERLCAWVPTLHEHRCSYGEPGGFIKRLQEGTWPAHILEHITLELQNLAGMPGGFGKARSTSQRGVYKLVVSAWQEDIARHCLEAARDLVMAAIEDRPFDVGDTVTRLKGLASHYLLDPSTHCIVTAAEEKDRRIPTFRLPTKNLVQLGYGARQRRIWAAETDLTGAIAEGIARDPDLTHEFLKTCGLPVPARSHVDNAEEAWEEAQDIGLPVYVKPGSHASGFTGTKVGTRAEMDAAFQQAAAANAANPDSDANRSPVVVEQCVSGRQHRLLVVSGKLVAAARLQGDPGSSKIPHAAEDVTSQIDPSTAEAACLAAKIVGLNIAGIDVVLEDAERPLSSTHGAITGVHAGPELIPHLQPATGAARPVGRAIIDGLFPNGDDGRIPIVGITGSSGRTEVALLVAEILSLSGKRTGLACGEGLFFNRRQVDTKDCGNWNSGRRILMDRSVEAAVLEHSPEAILLEGLPYDRCLVGVLTAIEPEAHFGRNYIDSRDQVFQMIRTQLDVVLSIGVAVLNAADPMAVEMAPLCDGQVIFIATDPTLPTISNHLAAGGRAVLIREGQIVLAMSTETTVIAPLASIPLLVAGADPARIVSVLSAIAAAWGLGIASHVIRTAIETYPNESFDLPRSKPTDHSNLSLPHPLLSPVLR